MVPTRRRSPVGRLALVFLVAGVTGARGQQSVPSFPSEVELVTVDAVVLDSHGNPVPGLTKDDFVVEEDGRTQPIVSFEAFSLQPGPSKPPSVVASNAPAVRGVGRAFAILLDDVSMQPALVEAARKAIQSFLDKSVRDGDQVTLATTSGSTWWSARIPEGRDDLEAVLSRVLGRRYNPPNVQSMTDYEAFRINNFESAPTFESPSDPGEPSSGLNAVTQRVRKRWTTAGLCPQAPTRASATSTAMGSPLCDPMVRARAAEIDARRKARERMTFQAVRRELDALSIVHGRKSLIFFSPGFVEDFGPDLRRVAADSRLANTAIYFVDARGLMGRTGFGSVADPRALPQQTDQLSMRFEGANLASAGAETLADETGGFSVRNTNDLAAGAFRIANESRAFYLLGFVPPEGKGPGQWRKLQVKVNRPGLRVRARKGYTLRLPPTEAEKPEPKNKKEEQKVAPAIAKALDSAQEESGIPLRAMAYVFEPRGDKVHVVVAAEFDASRVTLEKKGDKRTARVEASVVALLRDKPGGFRHDDMLDVSVGSGQTPAWRAFTREFELPPGVAQARVAVRDPATGAVGSVWQRFEVPTPGTLRLSTPIITDRVEPDTGGGGRPVPALAVHRVFPPHGGLYCQFQVFGAALSPGQGPPQVAAGLQLTHDGRVILDAQPTPIKPDADGRIVRMVGLKLEGMAEGEYDLRLRVQDQVSGSRVERVEPFRIQPGG